MNGPALIVFAKAPEPGRVKTRLCPPLTPVQAADLYAAFLGDALDAYAQFGREEGVAVRVFLKGVPAAIVHLVPSGVSVHQQNGAGLGPAMFNAFMQTFAAGYDTAVVIGTDHPTLPLDFVRLAFQSIEAPMSCAVGPSSDGGYYLLGTGELTSSLFDMEYSHDGVFDATVQAALDAGLETVVLPTHYDVDDASSLERLLAERRDGAPVGPRTALALDTLTAAISLQA